MSKNQFTGTATQPQRNRKFVNLIRTSTVPKHQSLLQTDLFELDDLQSEDIEIFSFLKMPYLFWRALFVNIFTFNLR